MTDSIEKSYPNVADWVMTQGWIEIGQDDENDSFIRVLDEGGLVWEGRQSYDTLDDAMRDLEKGLAEWLN